MESPVVIGQTVWVINDHDDPTVIEAIVDSFNYERDTNGSGWLLSCKVGYSYLLFEWKEFAFGSQQEATDQLIKFVQNDIMEYKERLSTLEKAC